MEAVQNAESTPSAKRTPPAPRNGVDTPTLFATIGAVRDQPEMAQFQFRATNRWVAGTHSETRIESFHGAGGEHVHTRAFEYGGDHPAVLCGADNAPTPAEFLLHALATCLTAGIGNIAAARGVTLSSVRSTVTGDIDLRGILGISDEVRNGYTGIRVEFEVAGDAPAEKLEQIVEQSKARSAVFDVITGRVPVEIDVHVL